MGEKLLLLPTQKMFQCHDHDLAANCDSLYRALKMNQLDAAREIVSFVAELNDKQSALIVEKFMAHKENYLRQIEELPAKIKIQPYNNFLYSLCRLFQIDLNQAINVFIRFRQKAN